MELQQWKHCHFELKGQRGTSSQDGGVGWNPSLPHTTKRRITANLKSTNNQKCQKIKQYGTLTTKELKKQFRTTRLVRREDRENPLRGGGLRRRAGWTGNWGSELTVDCCGRGCHGGRNPQCHMRVRWKVRYNRAGELHCSLSGSSPTDSAAVQQEGSPCLAEYLRPRPLIT